MSEKNMGNMGCSLAANQARNELQEKSLPGWVGNLAVLGTLEGESIQPLNFTSTAETSLNVPGLLQFFQVWKRGEDRSSIYQNGVVFWWIFLKVGYDDLENKRSGPGVVW